MLKVGNLAESLKAEYGLIAWLRQEAAFGDGPGRDTQVVDFEKSVKAAFAGTDK